MICIYSLLKELQGGLFKNILNIKELEQFNIKIEDVNSHVCDINQPDLCPDVVKNERFSIEYHLRKDHLYHPTLAFIDCIDVENYEEHTIDNIQELYNKFNYEFFRFRYKVNHTKKFLFYPYAFSYIYAFEVKDERAKTCILLCTGNEVKVKKNNAVFLLPFPIVDGLLLYREIHIFFVDENDNVVKSFDVDILGGMSNYNFHQAKPYYSEKYQYCDGMVNVSKLLN
jgi:hypothetical protein